MKLRWKGFHEATKKKRRAARKMFQETIHFSLFLRHRVLKLFVSFVKLRLFKSHCQFVWIKWLFGSNHCSKEVVWKGFSSFSMTDKSKDTFLVTIMWKNFILFFEFYCTQQTHVSRLANHLLSLARFAVLGSFPFFDWKELHFFWVLFVCRCYSSLNTAIHWLYEHL